MINLFPRSWNLTAVPTSRPFHLCEALAKCFECSFRMTLSFLWRSAARRFIPFSPVWCFHTATPKMRLPPSFPTRTCPSVVSYQDLPLRRFLYRACGRKSMEQTRVCWSSPARAAIIYRGSWLWSAVFVSFCLPWGLLLALGASAVLVSFFYS